MNPIIFTRSGVSIDLRDSEFASPTPDDIFWGLAHRYRYSCQTDPAFNLGHHSLFVGRALEVVYNSPTLSQAGLFHDAGEAILWDVPAPVKPYVYFRGSSWEDLEHKITYALFDNLGIPRPVLTDPRLIAIDMLSRVLETELLDSSSPYHKKATAKQIELIENYNLRDLFRKIYVIGENPIEVYEKLKDSF